MTETYTHCAVCRTDTRLGVEVHCVLCHTNYAKGSEHWCAVLDAATGKAGEVVIVGGMADVVVMPRSEDVKREPRTPFHGKHGEPISFHPASVPKE